MNYTLITNSVAPTQVEDNGDHYLIENVPFIRAMELSGGYVPSESIEETINEWVGKPPTLNHPRDSNGEPIAANKKPELQLGTVINAEFDGDVGRGDIRINKRDLNRLGGEAEDIKKALENGEQIEVSSQYKAKSLSPGTYDGKHRSNVEKIVEPDSVAILPNKSGVCSIEDGCGINPQMVANAEVSLTATDDAVSPEGGQAEADGDTSAMQANKQVDGIEFSDTSAGNLDESEIPNDDFESHYVFDADTKSESSFPLVDAEGNLRRGNVASAFRFRDDAPDTEKLLDVLEAVNNEFEDRPIDPENFGDMEGNSAFERIKSFLGMTEQPANEPAESGVDTANDTDADLDTTMSDKTEELVSNHGFDAENLPAEDTECFDRIYDAVTSNDSETEDDETVIEMNEEEFLERVEERAAEKAAEVVANKREQSEKEQLVDEIVSNSAEYSEEDKEDLLDTPTKVLKGLKTDAKESTPAVPGNGMSANFDDSEDYEDFPSPIASERAKELNKGD